MARPAANCETKPRVTRESNSLQDETKAEVTPKQDVAAGTGTGRVLRNEAKPAAVRGRIVAAGSPRRGTTRGGRGRAMGRAVGRRELDVRLKPDLRGGQAGEGMSG